MFKVEMCRVYARIIRYSLKKFAVQQEYELDDQSVTAFSESCALDLYKKLFETSGEDRTRKGTERLL